MDLSEIEALVVARTKRNDNPSLLASLINQACSELSRIGDFPYDLNSVEYEPTDYEPTTADPSLVVPSSAFDDLPRISHLVEVKCDDIDAPLSRMDFGLALRRGTYVLEGQTVRLTPFTGNCTGVTIQYIGAVPYLTEDDDENWCTEYFPYEVANYAVALYYLQADEQTMYQNTMQLALSNYRKVYYQNGIGAN